MRAKCSAEDYIQWLIASPKVASCTEAARSGEGLAAHDAYTRLLSRLEPTSEALWEEVKPLVSMRGGWLIVDDSTLEKPHARHMDLVMRHWSGSAQAVVSGINLVTLLWTDGDVAIPVDWRVLNTSVDGLSKNDHFRQMLHTARERGLSPHCVLCDSWYAANETFKLLRELGWSFFAGIKSNRHASIDDGLGNREFSALPWPTPIMRVHLKGFGWLAAHRVAHWREGEDDPHATRYFVTNLSDLDEAGAKGHHEVANLIEQYHRTIKQSCHITRCQARRARVQLNHIALAIRAFVRLERHRDLTGISAAEFKTSLIRRAVASYRSQPQRHLVL